MMKKTNAALLLFVLCAPGDGALADTPAFCGICANGGPPPMTANSLTLTCTDANAVVTTFDFVSYGTATGACGSFQRGSCDAADATSVVESACVGRHSCAVWPNTTTFGDPCFGTVKNLVVQAHCSTGVGTAQCVVPGPPPPPPPVNATVSVDWSTATGPLITEPSLQVVAHRLLARTSPIHDQAFASLKQLGARHVRYVPWFPYAKYAVAELEPPSGPLLCGPTMWASGGQSQPFELTCGPSGGTIQTVDFASFGTPTGRCGAYAVNSGCHDADSASVVSSKCVGQPSCVLGPADFTAPCSGATYLAVQVRCSNASAMHTYWNFTLLDQMMLDFWAAVDGDQSEPIPNFSTPPTWLYDSTAWQYADDPNQPWYGYEQGRAPAANLTALGDYYGRLLAWYTQGGFFDEYNQWQESGHFLNITLWEVFNEVDYEHGHTPQTYTLEYDAIVAGIRRWADPQRKIKFVALSLPNIDPESTIVEWAKYFLDPSNHAEDVRDSLNYIGYHAYPTNGPYTPDPTSFSAMFAYAAGFLETVQAVDEVIAALSPATRTMLDETGTDMDNVLSPGFNPPSDSPLYWVASGAYFAYMWAGCAALGGSVVVVGQSQLMDSPGQEPSVTLLDWATGNGTAKYWVDYLLIDSFSPGDDKLYATKSSSSQVFAQGFANGASQRLLLINTENSQATVTLSGESTCSIRVVDEATLLGPPRAEPCGPGSTVVLAPFATAVVTLA